MLIFYFYYYFFFYFAPVFTTVRVADNVILPVLYGCETWSLTLRKEHRLRVFDNRLLRKVFGFNMD